MQWITITNKINCSYDYRLVQYCKTVIIAINDCIEVLIVIHIRVVYGHIEHSWVSVRRGGG